jgi:hypothetical protein
LTATTYTGLADAVLVVHTGFVLFVVGGQGLIVCGWAFDWHWTRHAGFRLAHLIAILVVVLQSWLGIFCPLTLLESQLRQLAGAEGYPVSFIGYWLYRLLYYRAPLWTFTLAYSLFALLVIVTWIRHPPRWRG